MAFKLAAAGLAAALALGAMATGATAQTLDRREFNVVGTWGFLNNWSVVEKPFWTEDLPKASGGALKGNARAQTELNLRGTEILRLLKQGVFDFAAALPIYVDEGSAVIEASDIAGVARDFKSARAVVDAWLPEMQKVMRDKHGASILATFVFPEQVIWCRGDVKSAAELKGKKVRVQGTSQGDFITALGGIPVTIAFAEVLPALEKGVVDCGITGTMAGYKAKWPEVTQSLIWLPVNYTIGFWAVNNATAQFKALEDRAWTVIAAESDEGVHCATGTGACTQGPVGKLALVKPSPADVAAREKALNEVVLPNWAKRCGTECATAWNNLVGKTYGLTARAN
jgi:TRAP-type C4-dicarboxylate transport system substrate-binding protein